MKKYLLLALISTLSIAGFSQVYLSKIYNDILILGPHNVAPHCDEIAQSYVGDIENLYDVLVKEQEQLKAEVEKFNEMTSPSKGDKFKASEQQGDIDLIEDELTILMQFKEAWLKIIDQTPVKLELVDAIRSGQCAKIKSPFGDFVHNEFMVTLDKDIEKIKVVEHFATEYRDSIPQWETKINEDCASDDPNDCLMWCYLNKPGGEALVDFTGDVYRLKDSQIGSQFNLDSKQNVGSRELTIDLQGSTIDIINVVKSDNNLLLQVNGFETIECEN